MKPAPEPEPSAYDEATLLELERAGIDVRGDRGDEKISCRAYRAYILEEKALPEGLAVGFSGGTANHYAGYTTVAYCSTPVEGRRKQVANLLEQKTNGHCAHAGSDEFGTTSHNTWHDSPHTGSLLVACRRDDAELVDLLVEWIGAEQRHNLLHRCPAIRGSGKPAHVVRCGARMHGGKEADQRKNLDVLTAYRCGERVRMPNGYREYLDWTALYFSTILADEFPDVWRRILDVSREGGAPLPKPRSGYRLSTWSANGGGHIAEFTTPVQMLKPSFWARATYRSPRVEEYGGREEWGKFYSPDVPPAEVLPVPKPPAGAPGLDYPRAAV